MKAVHWLACLGLVGCVNTPMAEQAPPLAAKAATADKLPARITPPPENRWQCGPRPYCKDMQSCEQAKFYLNECGQDSLDRDGDGIPCENVCAR
ncbi:MAG: excalibur calcium-binding domain-containing protein [Thiothrix sp.]|nr:excalibur calcium-binding domain-containing protein [Thiothrix sp.]HPQ96248.1 excalibur calcium-binding domain-containing protein [Thiolinea sp.]